MRLTFAGRFGLHCVALGRKHKLALEINISFQIKTIVGKSTISLYNMEFSMKSKPNCQILFLIIIKNIYIYYCAVSITY